MKYRGSIESRQYSDDGTTIFADFRAYLKVWFDFKNVATWQDERIARPWVGHTSRFREVGSRTRWRQQVPLTTTQVSSKA